MKFNLLSALTFLCFSTLAFAKPQVYYTETFAVGTLITGQFKTETKQEAAACYKVLNDETRRLEYLLSAYDRDSEVSKINRDSGKWVEISPETFEILEQSKNIAKATDGSFEPTLGRLISLWSVDQPDHRVPNEKKIKEALTTVGYEKIQLKKEKDKYFARIEPNQEIALGAIGKGFIADKVIKKLKEKGCKDSLLSFGGNIIGSGSNSENNPWLLSFKFRILHNPCLV